MKSYVEQIDFNNIKDSINIDWKRCLISDTSEQDYASIKAHFVAEYLRYIGFSSKVKTFSITKIKIVEIKSETGEVMYDGNNLSNTISNLLDKKFNKDGQNIISICNKYLG